MTKICVDLDAEALDKIIQAQLVETRAILKQYLGAGRNIFVWGDPESDDAEIQKHIDALELLLTWYSTPEQLKVLGLESES